MAAIREQFTGRERVKEALKDVEERIILHGDIQQDVAPLLTRIQEIDQAMSNLLLLVSHSADSSIYDEKFKALTKEKRIYRRRWMWWNRWPGRIRTGSGSCRLCGMRLNGSRWSWKDMTMSW